MKLFSNPKNSELTAAPLSKLTNSLLLIGAVAMCVAMLLGTATADAGEYLLFRKPTVSKTQIVFSYAGDLWIVDRSGGEARRPADSGCRH